MNVKDYRHATADDLLKHRIIMVEGELSEETMVFINCALLRLDSESSEEIVLYFRSKGGHAQYGQINYDLLTSIRSPTRGIVARADSAASMILMGCKKRQILPSGSIIIHSVRGLDIRGLVFNEDTIDEQISSLKAMGMALANRSTEIYLAKSKMDEAKLKEIIRAGDLYDGIIFAQEALELGLVDEILKVDGFKKDGYVFP